MSAHTRTTKRTKAHSDRSRSVAPSPRSATKARRGGKSQFLVLFERSPLPTWVYSTETLRFLAVNDAAVRQYGYSRAEFARMTIRDIRPPEELPRLSLNLAGPRRDEERTSPWMHRRKDGTVIQVETLSNSISFFGEPARLVVAIDITDRLQADAERRQVEEKYRSIFENSTEAITQTTPDGRYLAANPATARMLGYESPEQLIAEVGVLDHSFYVKPGRRLEFMRLMDDHGEVSGFESEIFRKDGTTMWISENSKAIRDRDGTLLYYQGAAQDITARKLAEEALRQAEEKYRGIFENATEEIIQTTPGGQYLVANPAGARMLGFDSPEQLIAEYNDLNTCFYVQPGRRAEFLRLLERDGHVTGFESEVYRRDRSTIWISENSRAIRDANGKLLYIQGTAQDITARKLAEEALRAAETRYRLLVERIPAITYIVSQDGRKELLYISPQVEQLLGFSVDEWMRDPGLWARQIHPDDRPRVLAEDAASWEQKRPSVSEYRILTKDGRVVWLHDEMHHINERGMEPFSQGIEFDITERKQAEEQVRQQMRHMAALRRIDAAISGTFDLRAMLSMVLNDILQVLDVDAAAVSLLKPESMTLDIAAARGFHSRQIETSPLVLTADIGIKVMLERRAIGTADLQSAPEGGARRALMQAEKFVFYQGTPLVSKGRVTGMLEVFHRSAKAGGDEWLRLIDALAAQTAIAVENATMFQDLQRSNVDLAMAYEATIEGWSRALDLRDRETEGHTLRVTEQTLSLARALGVRQDDLVHIRRGALLHDIGKIGVPDSILHKPGPLTDEEWSIMRRHPEIAYEMLSPIAYLGPALDIPYCHHEKWDGSGYPRGLRGEQIPLAARMFAVVDVWDALSSERPYRGAREPDKVVNHLRSHNGSHFDPRVLDAFLNMIAKS